MSHTRILDKIRERFVNLPSAEPGSKVVPEKRRNTRRLHIEDRQEGYFNCEAFVDVSAEVIAQFFE